MPSSLPAPPHTGDFDGTLRLPPGITPKNQGAGIANRPREVQGEKRLPPGATPKNLGIGVPAMPVRMQG